MGVWLMLLATSTVLEVRATDVEPEARDRILSALVSAIEARTGESVRVRAEGDAEGDTDSSDRASAILLGGVTQTLLRIRRSEEQPYREILLSSSSSFWRGEITALVDQLFPKPAATAAAPPTRIARTTVAPHDPTASWVLLGAGVLTAAAATALAISSADKTNQLRYLDALGPEFDSISEARSVHVSLSVGFAIASLTAFTACVITAL